MDKPTMSDIIALRPAEAARAAGVSVPTLYSWARQKGFPLIRIGGCTLVMRDAFIAWLEEHKDEASNGNI